MFIAQLVIRVVESLTVLGCRERTNPAIVLLQKMQNNQNSNLPESATIICKKKSAKFAAFLLPLTSDQPTVAKFNCFLSIRAGINLLELTN